MNPTLRRYQVMSLVVGTMLLIFCVFIILRHGFGIGASAEMVVAQIHGILYIVYLVTVVMVYLAYRPSVKRLVLMILSGMIPFMAFFVERNTVEELGQQQPVAPSGS